MKHPVLTRLFAIVLAILSLIMTAVGGTGVSKAAKDRDTALMNVNRLKGRIEEYSAVTLALDGTTSYEEANKLLTERQEQHDADAAKHRSDLAMYTATKGGIASGTEALDKAEQVLDEAWEQFRQGEAEFNKQKAAFFEGYQQYIEGKKQLEEGYALIAALEALPLLPGTIVEIGVKTVPADELAPSQPDEPPTEGGEDSGGESGDEDDKSDGGDDTGSGDDSDGGGSEDTNTVNTETPSVSDETTEASAERNDEAAAEEILPETEDDGPAVAAALSAAYGQKPRLVFLAAGTEEPEETEMVSVADRQQALEAYDSLINAYVQLETLLSALTEQAGNLTDGTEGDGADSLAQLEQLQSGLAMSRQGAESMRGMLASGSGYVTGQELETAVSTHRQLKMALQFIIGQISQMLTPMLADMTEKLDAGMAELTKLEPMMTQGKAALDDAAELIKEGRAQLESGSAQLRSGRKELEKTLNDLDDQLKELQEEKETLDAEALELSAMSAETKNQQNMEKRQTSLRLMLLDRKGIEQGVDEGLDLQESARTYAERMEQNAQRDYKLRLILCILMIVGGIAGILGIPAAFEKLKGRFPLIAPVVLCLLCAAAVEILSETMGWGRAYSAIFTGLFAVTQLFIVVPKAKKTR